MATLIYTLNFKDINENDIYAELYKEGESNLSALELLPSSEAIIIDYNGSDDVFKPLKLSGCKISILSEVLLTGLYSGKSNEISVKIFRNNKLFWFGFLTPNIYSSDYTDDYNNLTLEFIDTLSVLEHFKYETGKEENQNDLCSFYNILSSIFNRVDKSKLISDIYIHNSLQVNNTDDVLNQLFINTRNFFDEEGEPATCKDVLEDISRYLGMTLVQFENKYLFIDYEALKNDSCEVFIKYDRQTGKMIKTNLPVKNIDINSNIYESNASISLNDTYNKIGIIANNNPVNDLIPDLFDEEDLMNQNTNLNNIYEKEEIKTENKKQIKYVYSFAFFDSQENWSILKPTPFLGEEIKEITPDNINSIHTGAFFQKNASYNTEVSKPVKPSKLSYTTYLTFIGKRFTTVGLPSIKPVFDSFLKVKRKNYVLLKNGYFILNLSYKLSQDFIADDQMKSSDAVYYSGKYSAGFVDTRFACRLKVGDYYYNGREWILYQNYLDNIEKYNRVTYEGEFDGVTKYYYITYDSTGDEVKNWLTEEEYNEINLKDRFWLVHENEKDEDIFNDWKNLTNQVSYEYNLPDSQDGILIPLPDFILHGEIEFELCPPDSLGRPQNYRTDKEQAYTHADIIHFKDLKLIYTNNKYTEDIFNLTTYDPDVKYENIINSDYVNEFDDLQFRINTYTEKAGSYSFVATKKSNSYDYIEGVYNLNTNETGIQEEHILRKYYNYYSSPKFRYENSLDDVGINPIDLLFENTLNKRFFINQILYNLSTCSVDIECCEI